MYKVGNFRNTELIVQERYFFKKTLFLESINLTIY